MSGIVTVIVEDVVDATAEQTAVLVPTRSCRLVVDMLRRIDNVCVTLFVIV